MPMMRYFGVLKLVSGPTIDLLQNDLQRKSSLIIISDVNMTSKQAFLQKVTFLLNSSTKR